MADEVALIVNGERHELGEGFHPHSFERVWRRDFINVAPYVYASLDVVHQHGCAATRHGKKAGQCNCGGDELLKSFIADGGAALSGKGVIE